MRLFLLCLTLMLTIFGQSQIVNIENKRLSAKKEGFSGSADFHLNYTLNTKSLFQVGNKLKLAYLKGRSYTLFLTDQALVKSNAESFINKGFEHVRFNYTLKDSGKVVYELFQQGQFNKIQRISMRLLIGTGFRFMLIDHEKYQFNLGTGIMGEYEELTDLQNSQDVLSANYVSFDGQFTPSFGLNTITYFQPKLIDFGNYRLANETSLRFRVNKFLSFKVIYALTHDSRNIEGVRKTNYYIKNTLSFNF